MNRYIKPILINKTMSNLYINNLNSKLMKKGICPINLSNEEAYGINNCIKIYENLKIIYITSTHLNNYLIGKNIKSEQILYIGLDNLIDNNISKTIFNQRPNMAINIINNFVKNNPVYLCIDIESFDSNITPLCLFKDKLDFVNFNDYYIDLKFNLKNIDLIGLNSINQKILPELFACITKDFEFV